MFKITSKISIARFFSGLVVIMGLLLLILAIVAKVTIENNSIDSDNISASSVFSGSTVIAEPNKNNDVLYIIDAGNGKIIYKEKVVLTEKSDTVFTILKTLSEDKKYFEIKYNYNFPKLGVLVESIGGIKGDSEKYWQFYLNGRLGQLAADKQELKSGDTIEWRFEKTNF